MFIYVKVVFGGGGSGCVASNRLENVLICETCWQLF